MSDRPASSVSAPTLPGYEILGELRRDRLGVVYHARHRVYGREVALRVVEDRAHEGLRDLTGVCHSAEVAGKHPHPHLLALHDSGENEGQLYLDSDLPPELSLKKRLEKGPLPPRDAAALVATIARAVHHLHRHHSLHLGLTSAGVFLARDGSPRVGDLGLSGLLHNRPGVKYVGDADYAAPEQVRGERADERADVYGLGCLLAECLTTRPPTGSLALTGVPPALAGICRKALGPDPERRHASAAELADDLDHYQSGEVVAPGAMTNAVGWLRSNPVAVALAALLLVVLAASATGLTAMSNRVAEARAEADKRASAAEDLANDARKAAEKQSQSASGDAKQKILDAEFKAQQASIARDKERKRVQEEERGRLDAEKRFAEESKNRALAEEKTRLAEQEREKAREAQSAIASEFTRLYVAQGNALLESGDSSAALLAFARALEFAAREKLPEDAHRLRIATTLALCPRPMSLRRFEKGDAALVAFAPNGKRVLVVGADGVATVRDAGTGELVGKKLVHGAAVSLAVLSPDGTRVLSADRGGVVRVWKVEDGKELFEGVEVGSVPAHLSFSGDGKRFLIVRPVAGEETTAAEAQVRNAATGDLIGERISDHLAPRSAALSYDGSRVLLCGNDSAAKVFDVKTTKQVGNPFSHGGDLTSAAFSADGQRVLTTGDGSAKVWNAITGKGLMTVDHDSPIEPQLDDSGRLVLTVSKDRAVRVFDVATAKQVGVTIRPRTSPRQVVLSADGRFVLLTEGQTTRLLDAQTGRPATGPLAHAAPPTAVALSPDGARAMTFDGKLLRVWNLTAGESSPPGSPPEESGVVTSPDGKRLARITGNSVQLFDAKTGATLGPALKHKATVSLVAFSATGERLVTVATPADSETTQTWDLRIWDVESGKSLTEPMEHLREIAQLRYLNADRIISIALDKKARLWDAKTGKLVGKSVEMSEDIVLAELSLDGKLLITCDKVGMTKAWNAETGDAVGEGGMPSAAAVTSLSFSDDGKSLATCCGDGAVSVWTIESNKRAAKFDLADAATHAVFSPEGGRLLVGCADGSARLWDIREGKEVIAPLMHDTSVVRVAFSADARWLLTASGNAVRFWDVKSGESVGPPIPNDTHLITHISYSKSGLTTQSRPGSRWVRALTSDTRSPAQLVELAIALSGREDVGGGRFSVVSAEALQGAWRRSEEKTPGDFSVPTTRLLDWARRGAAECEARSLWGGAVRHLDVLLASSNDLALNARRGKALLELGRYELALADLDKALAKGSTRWELWANRGDAAAALGRWERAAADYTEATKREERNGELWRKLGGAEAERERWKEASSALAKAAKINANDAALWHEQAVVLLAVGDVKGYRQHCSRMSKRFGTSARAREALASACALAAEAVSEYKELLVETDQRRLAALLIRAGQSAKAVSILEKLADDDADAATWWLLVLAHQTAGQKDAAKKSQAKAESAKPRAGASWVERQTGALWRKEAESALKGG